MVLVDLQKAFDTINHSILFKNDTSYLSNRKFIINIETVYLDKASITCVVPQGSILDSLVFLIYINNMPQAVDSELLLYANETYLVFQLKDIEKTEEHLN